MVKKTKHKVIIELMIEKVKCFPLPMDHWINSQLCCSTFFSVRMWSLITTMYYSIRPYKVSHRRRNKIRLRSLSWLHMWSFFFSSNRIYIGIALLVTKRKKRTRDFEKKIKVKRRSVGFGHKHGNGYRVVVQRAHLHLDDELQMLLLLLASHTTIAKCVYNQYVVALLTP